MYSVDRILGEAKSNVRPPTKKELTDPYQAYYYATEVLKGRFPKGEAAIATDPYWAFYYATEVLKGRFPEGEAAIAKDHLADFPNWAEDYLQAFPEAKLEWIMKGWLDWLEWDT